MRTLSLLASIVVATLSVPHAVAAEGAATAETRTVQVGADRIAYRKMGSGAPIVLVNRFRGTLDTWDPAFLDALARHRTVILFELPGVGYSQGAQPATMEQGIASLDGFADALGLQKFDLLGWSWGGLLAQAYVVDRPARVDRLVLLATNPAGKNEIPLQPAFLERALKPVNDLADEEVLFFEPASALSRERARQSRERIRVRPDVDARIPSKPAQFERYFAAAGAFHEDAAGRREKLARIGTPILVIAGDHDTSTAGQNWFPLIGQMRNARFVFYSQTGHAPHHQYPDEVAGVVQDFLDRTGDG
ncbi:alpha/beta fold hydrolase [Lysobacter arvi]|uniref:Alpha/beta hydrolase n=1 Tax=Lysobacter arvi TaxID=3038776 RepID=A0ABU1C9T3_9GAMM|nr:alpha/beta hydrolase [Lysobacter arvi]MDR0181953.1 alpha/beta hydrolase [Lysobacter arvi]